MSIEKLAAVLPPPAGPVETPRRGAEDWAAVEGGLGTPLPPDYKAFVEGYGTGAIDDFLWVFNPFSANEHANLISQTKVRLDSLRSLRDEFQLDIRYELFPAGGGLLPFGATANGDVLFWETAGEPQDWAVIVGESRASEYESFGSNMTGFLHDILSRKEVSRIFPEDFPTASPVFKPVA
jgi:hypothetical protein